MPHSDANLHSHVFLGEGHERNERRTWTVIALCGLMMVVEIVGGLLFGSIALVADGLHMSTHASALLLAALLPKSDQVFYWAASMAVAFFRFLRQPNRPIPLRPVAKSAIAVGSGIHLR